MELLSPEIKKVIVAPLNWGLGHATRCIPIIESLLGDNKEVLVASDGQALDLLKLEFPKLLTIEVPSYKVQYKHSSLGKIVLSNSLNIAKAIQAENKVCKQLCTTLKPDMIISDSRFGFRHSSVPSVIITHQLNPLSDNPLLKGILERGNRYFINQFEECWIPDSEDHLLSGILSQNRRIKNIKFIGALSRFKPAEKTIVKDFDLTLILSGPEPARSDLEKKLIAVLENTNKKICLIRGTQDPAPYPLPEKWKSYNLADSKTINNIILASRTIVSRSGYTSIMDYHALGIGAYLIPTPGQSEQEYLAHHLNGKRGFHHLTDLQELTQL